MPASKSFAQRAILAAALADGCSHLSGYSPCGDSESAIRAAEAIGAEICREDGGRTLAIRGVDAAENGILRDSIDCGESGLLTRLMIPLLAATGPGDCLVEGRGSLLRRPLNSASDIMAAFGVLLANGQDRRDKEIYVPLKVRGRLIPGTADVPGNGGSQLISGLLMALPLCDRDSVLHVNEPKSIPYMYITLGRAQALRHKDQERNGRRRRTARSHRLVGMQRNQLQNQGRTALQGRGLRHRRGLERRRQFPGGGSGLRKRGDRRARHGLAAG